MVSVFFFLLVKQFKLKIISIRDCRIHCKSNKTICCKFETKDFLMIELLAKQYFCNLEHKVLVLLGELAAADKRSNETRLRARERFSETPLETKKNVLLLIDTRL